MIPTAIVEKTINAAATFLTTRGRLPVNSSTVRIPNVGRNAMPRHLRVTHANAAVAESAVSSSA